MELSLVLNDQRPPFKANSPTKHTESNSNTSSILVNAHNYNFHSVSVLQLRAITPLQHTYYLIYKFPVFINECLKTGCKSCDISVRLMTSHKSSGQNTESIHVQSPEMGGGNFLSNKLRLSSMQNVQGNGYILTSLHMHCTTKEPFQRKQLMRTNVLHNVSCSRTRFTLNHNNNNHCLCGILN